MKYTFVKGNNTVRAIDENGDGEIVVSGLNELFTKECREEIIEIIINALNKSDISLTKDMKWFTKF